MNQRFIRTEMMLGSPAMDKLQRLGEGLGLEDYLE